MAPTAPGTKHRQKALARLSDPTLLRKTHRPDSAVTPTFTNSKRDKQQIRHAQLLSKITKPAPRPRKTRRPSKKLTANLGALADALADIRDGQEDGDGDGDKEWDGSRELTKLTAEGKIRRKSMRSRPGALKRKEKVVKAEMARFGANLAQLAGLRVQEGEVVPVAEAAGKVGEGGTGMEVEGKTSGQTVADAGAEEQPKKATTNRWAAIRGFISSTLEQNPAFSSKG